MQDLAGLGYALDGLIAGADSGDADVPADLRDLRTELSRVVRDLRDTIGDLRSPLEPDRTLGDALSALARRLADRHGWQLRLDVSISGGSLPPDVEGELFRIGQEALTNVAKHAAARSVELTCRVAPPSALLRISDDGIGLGTRRGRSDSYGFVTMLERAQRVGASLSVAERHPAGTSVLVRLGATSGRDAAADGG